LIRHHIGNRGADGDITHPLRGFHLGTSGGTDYRLTTSGSAAPRGQGTLPTRPLRAFLSAFVLDPHTRNRYGDLVVARQFHKALSPEEAVDTVRRLEPFDRGRVLALPGRREFETELRDHGIDVPPETPERFRRRGETLAEAYDRLSRSNG
jgi:hypothetical protein